MTVDEYLAGVPEPKRGTLEQLRATIREILPDAEETISYGMPAYRLHGRVVAGFAAFKDHLAYVPHSGSVFNELPAELAGYQKTAGSLHFPIDEPLPRELVAKLISVRMKQLRRR